MNSRTTAHRQRTEATSEALVEAAGRLFGERGYATVSVSEIAAAVGVTTGAIYHQFGSKKDLFKAVYARALKDLAQSILVARADRDPTMLGDCEIFLEACTQPSFQRIVLLDAPAVLGPERVTESGRWFMERAIREARERREVGDFEIEPVARMLSASLKEAGLTIAKAEDSERARREAVAGTRLLLAGLDRK